MVVSKVKNEVIDLENIEVLAIFRGIRLCANMGIHKLIIESDYMLMIKELQNAAKSSSKLGNLLRDAKKTLFGEYKNSACK